MMQCTALGDRSLLLDFSDSAKPLQEIHGLSSELFLLKPQWAMEIIPGLDSLIIELNFSNAQPAQVRHTAQVELEKIHSALIKRKNKNANSTQSHRIQVCYHPDVAPDLADIAKACGLSIETTIQLHKESIYSVDILGFMPGFAYFSGLNPKLRLPRLPSPRPLVPLGSVAIAELQTAIYPRSTPGGWNLIGRSPDILFDIAKKQPGLFMPGDKMHIVEIGLDEFNRLIGLHSKESITPKSTPAENKNQSSGTITFKQAGAFTTIQDGPRAGLSHWGIGPGGAVDLDALELANALVGNPTEEAGLEITATGPTLLFSEDACIAWVGATCSCMVDGKRLPGNRPIWIGAGSTLQFLTLNPGMRAILAIGGGIDSPTILGRKGAHMSADIGPKRLTKGDALTLTNAGLALCSPFLKRLKESAPLPCFPKWQIRSPYTNSKQINRIYCMPGPHLSFLTVKDREKFWGTVWVVSKESNRMGIRLEGDFELKKPLPNIPSQAIHFGTVQFPPSQQPIVMLSEHQTTGGYPRLAEVIASEQSKLAQATPGTRIQFTPIDIDEADRLNHAARKSHLDTMYAIQSIISCGTKET